MSDEQIIIPCSGCGVPVLTWWAPSNGGLLRGEYIIIADTIWHPKCWDKQVDRLPPMPKDIEEAYDRFFGL